MAENLNLKLDEQRNELDRIGNWTSSGMSWIEFETGQAAEWAEWQSCNVLSSFGRSYLYELECLTVKISQVQAHGTLTIASSSLLLSCPLRIHLVKVIMLNFKVHIAADKINSEFYRKIPEKYLINYSAMQPNEKYENLNELQRKLMDDFKSRIKQSHCEILNNRSLL